MISGVCLIEAIRVTRIASLWEPLRQAAERAPVEHQSVAIALKAIKFLVTESTDTMVISLS